MLDDIFDVTATYHPHTSCPHCKERPANGSVPPGELVTWLIKHGWRESKQELVERMLQEFDVYKKEGK